MSTPPPTGSGPRDEPSGPAPHLVEDLTGKTPRKAAVAAWIGSVLEYFDFFIYATAVALVFNHIFFDKSDPSMGAILAMATFGVGYVARPIGAFVLGPLGDKFGRKRVLILTLIMMGISTFLIGCLPTYAQVGAWAPALLVTLRLLQGFSAAGEQAGANSMTLEHAPENRRAFFTSWTLSGTQAGQIIATAVFIPLAALGDEALLSWAWRIPFWASVLVVLAGIIIRRTLTEPPAFDEEADEGGKVHASPVKEVFATNWQGVLRVTMGACANTIPTIFGVWALSYATKSQQLPATDMLWVSVLGNVVALLAIPFWAIVADRVGRKPVFLGGAIGCAILMFFYLQAIGAKNVPMIFFVGIVMMGVVYSALNGVWPSLYGEMFSTRTRITGMAIGTQIGFALGGFAPTIAEAIVGTGHSGLAGWLPVWFLVVGAVVIVCIGALSTKETARLTLAEIDRVQDRHRYATDQVQPGTR